MTGNAVMGAQPYQQVAYDAMGQAIPTTMAAAQAGQEMAALGRQDLGTAAGQVLGAGSRGELAAAGGVQGILGAAMQGDTIAQQSAQNILAQTYPGQVSLGQGAMDVQQAAQTGQAYGSLGASGLGDLASRSAQLGSAALASLPQYGQRMESQGLQSAADIQRAAAMGQPSTRGGATSFSSISRGGWANLGLKSNRVLILLLLDLAVSSVRPLKVRYLKHKRRNKL
jgi:hypothetical protein